MLKIMLGWRLSFNACQYAGTKRHSSTSPSADRFFLQCFWFPSDASFFPLLCSVLLIIYMYRGFFNVHCKQQSIRVNVFHRPKDNGLNSFIRVTFELCFRF